MSPLVGVSFNNALIFGMYGNVLRYLMGSKYDNVPTINVEASAPYHDIFLAGFAAGLCGSVVTTPIELVKIRLQMQEQHTSLFHSDTSHAIYKGSIDCLWKSLKSEGIAGPFKGLGITVVRDPYSYGLYFASYEYIRRWAVSKYGPDWYSHPMVLLFGGGLAGMLGWLSCYPFDIVKSRVQASPPLTLRDKTTVKYYRTARECFVESYKHEGIQVFFKGLVPTLVRAFPVHAVTLWVYTMMMAWLP